MLCSWQNGKPAFLLFLVQAMYALLTALLARRLAAAGSLKLGLVRVYSR